MNHAKLIEYGLVRVGSSLRYPFDPDLPVLFVGSKMFALLGSTGEHESVNLKADPEEAWLLRQQYPGSVLPGYHMNKKHWNTVELDGTIDDVDLQEMVEHSYELVVRALPRRERDALPPVTG